MPTNTQLDSLNTNLAFLPVQFSRNKIEHVIDAADTTLSDRSGLRYYLEVLVPEFSGSSTFEKLVKMPGSEKPPASGGGLMIYEGCFFQLDELLDGFLEYQKPTFDQEEMAIISTLTMPYMAKETVENNRVLLAESTKEIASQWLLKAGLSERDFSAWGGTFFTDYMSQNRPFLTWQQDGKTIGEDQPEHLYFLLNCSPLPTTIYRRFRVHYTDGQTEVLEAGALQGGQAFQVVSVPVHAKALGLEAALVAYYEVWLADENRQRISQIRTYKIDHSYRSQERWILFNNSLGGWDTLRLLGEGSEAITTQRATAEMERPAGAAADFNELKVIYVQGSRSLTVSTGYFEGQASEQLRYLNEILLAREIYLVDSRGHQPLELLTTSLVDLEDNRDLVARTFSFRVVTPEFNHSTMPQAPAIVARPTQWRGVGIIYELDGFGKRTGYGRPLKLQKYYADDNSTYKPLTEKPNQPGDPDYIGRLPAAGVLAGDTPYSSQALSKSTTFKRSNCTGGQAGDVATIAIAAGKYGSEYSQAEADSKALAEYNLLNTQAYADLYGTCTAAPWIYAATVASGQWRYRVNEPGRVEIYYKPYGDTEPTIGNSWEIQGQNRPFVYPRFSTDLAFPVKPQKYYLLIYGPPTAQLNLKVYVDGVLTLDQLYYANNDGYELLFLDLLPSSGQKLYLKLTTV